MRTGARRRNIFLSEMDRDKKEFIERCERIISETDTELKSGNRISGGRRKLKKARDWVWLNVEILKVMSELEAVTLSDE
jgi:hypothetical protein